MENSGKTKYLLRTLAYESKYGKEQERSQPPNHQNSLKPLVSEQECRNKLGWAQGQPSKAAICNQDRKKEYVLKSSLKTVARFRLY